MAQLSTAERAAWAAAMDAPCVVLLGQIAKTAIGIVTGRNRFFILSAAEVAKHRLPINCVRPIFAKFDAAAGLSLKMGDVRVAQARGARSLLLHADEASTPGTALTRFCRLWPAVDRKQNTTLKKRKSWLQPDDGKIPDAFLTYMSHVGPRLVINDAAVNSTNTIHRLWFNQDVSEYQRRVIAFSMLSTFSQLGAELHGRTYGGGVLKHELREAAALPLVVPSESVAREFEMSYHLADTLLRLGEQELAQSVADAFTCAVVPGLAPRLSMFRNVLVRLRARRWRTAAP